MGEDWRECSWRLAFSKESVSFSGDREETVIIRSIEKNKEKNLLLPGKYNRTESCDAMYSISMI